MTTFKLRRFAPVALAAMLALLGCDHNAAKPSGGPKGPDPAAETAEDAFPGLYLTGDMLPIAADDRHIQLVSARRCADLAAILAAGQWRVADELSIPASLADAAGFMAGFGVAPGVLLARGDMVAFVTFSGDPTCSATIAKVERQEITVSGKGLPGTSLGWAVTSRCARFPSGELMVTLYFDTDAHTGGVVYLPLVQSGDTFTVKPDESGGFSIMLVTHGGQVLRAYSQLLQTAGTNKIPSGLTVQAAVPGKQFTGTVETSSAPDQPLAGTLKMSGLVDGTTGTGDLKMSVPFACLSVVEQG